MHDPNRCQVCDVMANVREDAAAIAAEHHPDNQDHRYQGRCSLCSFTRWPCDIYDLAVDWCEMHDALLDWQAIPYPQASSTQQEVDQ